MFNALLLDKTDAGFTADVRLVDEANLPPGDVLVQVLHSSHGIIGHRFMASLINGVAAIPALYYLLRSLVSYATSVSNGGKPDA